jgi:hypothetical protein
MSHVDAKALRYDLQGATDLEIGRAISFARYAPEVIRGEAAMALHRIAVRLGLYETGVEAALLAQLERADAEIVRLGGSPAGDPAAALTPKPRRRRRAVQP